MEKTNSNTNVSYNEEREILDVANGDIIDMSQKTSVKVKENHKKKTAIKLIGAFIFAMFSLFIYLFSKKR